MKEHCNSFVDVLHEHEMECRLKKVEKSSETFPFQTLSSVYFPVPPRRGGQPQVLSSTPTPSVSVSPHHEWTA